MYLSSTNVFLQMQMSYVSQTLQYAFGWEIKYLNSRLMKF